jgi:hypothetical protein
VRSRNSYVSVFFFCGKLTSGWRRNERTSSLKWVRREGVEEGGEGDGCDRRDCKYFERCASESDDVEVDISHFFRSSFAM